MAKFNFWKIATPIALACTCAGTLISAFTEDRKLEEKVQKVFTRELPGALEKLLADKKS